MSDKRPLIRITCDGDELPKIPKSSRIKPNLTIKLPGSVTSPILGTPPSILVTKSPVNSYTREEILNWSNDEVLHWLSSRYLYNIIPIFEENDIKGKHLVEARLDCLDFTKYSLSTDEREEVLSEVYRLLQDDVSTTPTGYPGHKQLHDVYNRDKYRAAIELSRSRETGSCSPSILLSPSPRSATLVTSKSPLQKQRSISESDMDTLTLSPLARKSPNLRSERQREMWTIFKPMEPIRVCCIEIEDYDNNISLYQDCERFIRIKDTVDNLGLQERDIVLEINGQLLCSKSTSLSRVNRILHNPCKTKLVLARSLKKEDEVSDKLQNVQNQLLLAESRWLDMREKLEYLKNNTDWYNTDIKSPVNSDNLSLVVKEDVEKMATDYFDKQDVLKVLAEKMSEMKKQKEYLDRLLTVVIDHAPWILSKMAEEIDTSLIDTDKEEWC